jgi:hypothetical protein
VELRSVITHLENEMEQIKIRKPSKTEEEREKKMEKGRTVKDTTS